MSTGKTLPPRSDVPPAGAAISWGRVACDGRRLVQLDARGDVVFRVPFNDVRRIMAGYGFCSRDPVVQAGLGLAMSVTGVYPAAHLIEWFRRGGTFFDFEALAIPLAALGLWLAASAFGRGYFIDVWSAAGRQRMVFGDGLLEAGFAPFLDGVGARAGVAVERM